MMELLYVLLGVGALVAVMESMSGSSDDGDLDSRPAEPETPSEPADPPDLTERDMLADADDPAGPQDPDSLPVTEFDPEALPTGVTLLQSDEADSPQLELIIDDADPESILLQGGILQMDSPHFDPGAFATQALVLQTSDAGAVIDSLVVTDDGALMIQHPDGAAPLVIAGGDFSMIDAPVAIADLRAADNDIQLSLGAGSTVFGGDGLLAVETPGDSMVAFGAGGGIFESSGLDYAGPNQVTTDTGPVVLSITPGDTVTPGDGGVLAGVIELRIAEGDPEAGPAVISGFDPAQSSLMVFEPGDPDVMAEITLAENDQGLQVFAGETLVAVLPGVSLADTPDITAQVERWGGADAISLLPSV